MEDKKKCDIGNVYIEGPTCSDGTKICIKHSDDHSLSAGILHKVEDGKPIPADAVLLERSSDGTLKEMCAKEPSKGPSKVNSNDFRNNWGNIFGNKVVGEA